MLPSTPPSSSSSWFLRLIGIAFVFGVTTVAWLILGGVTTQRTGDQAADLRGAVADLWGAPQAQEAPTFTAEWITTREEGYTETVEGKPISRSRTVVETQSALQSPGSSDLHVRVGLDPRRKGLVWYALYDVRFDGRWTYVHSHPESRQVRLSFAFPSADGLYDGFRFEVDGRDLGPTLVPKNGRVDTVVAVQPGQRVALRIAYKSRGLDTWRYVPATGVANIEKFTLGLQTDFADIDYPGQTLSPSSRVRQGEGWALQWRFERVVTGQDIGIQMPQRIQPGELAAELAWSAPVSLLFFFVVLLMVTTVRGIDLHPVNYALLAAAFFAFHLLFGYSADLLDVVPAFVLSSVVSLVLVVSYMRPAPPPAIRMAPPACRSRPRWPGRPRRACPRRPARRRTGRRRSRPGRAGRAPGLRARRWPCRRRQSLAGTTSPRRSGLRSRQVCRAWHRDRVACRRDSRRSRRPAARRPGRGRPGARRA